MPACFLYNAFLKRQRCKRKGRQDAGLFFSCWCDTRYLPAVLLPDELVPPAATPLAAAAPAGLLDGAGVSFVSAGDRPNALRRGGPSCTTQSAAFALRSEHDGSAYVREPLSAACIGDAQTTSRPATPTISVLMVLLLMAA
jgi:hypothetical protein